MKIGSREIGNGAPCLVVAEVGMAHDGSLGMAHAYIDAVAKAGVGAVKFQRHRFEDVGEWRQRPTWAAEESKAEYWGRTEFSDHEWAGLAGHADGLGLLFLCSSFSVEAAQAMEPLVPAWKVASGQVTNGPMLDYMAAHPKPTIISCGMCDEDELGSLMKRFRPMLLKEDALGDMVVSEWREPSVVLLHSASLYPTPLDSIGLGRMTSRRPHYEVGAGLARFECPVGLSDHSGTIWPALASATMGAAMVEVHVTFSRESYGPDTASSITIQELALLCEGIEAIRKAQQPVDREALLAGPLAEARRIYMVVS